MVASPYRRAQDWLREHIVADALLYATAAALGTAIGFALTGGANFVVIPILFVFVFVAKLVIELWATRRIF